MRKRQKKSSHCESETLFSIVKIFVADLRTHLDTALLVVPLLGKAVAHRRAALDHLLLSLRLLACQLLFIFLGRGIKNEVAQDAHSTLDGCIGRLRRCLTGRPLRPVFQFALEPRHLAVHFILELCGLLRVAPLQLPLCPLYLAFLHRFTVSPLLRHLLQLPH